MLYLKRNQERDKHCEKIVVNPGVTESGIEKLLLKELINDWFLSSINIV